MQLLRYFDVSEAFEGQCYLSNGLVTVRVGIGTYFVEPVGNKDNVQAFGAG